MPYANDSFPCSDPLSALSALSAPHHHSADAPGTATYLEGLDALENGKWNDAVSAFSQSIKAEEENADYYTARGVAEALSEQLEPAQRDLERANRLRPNQGILTSVVSKLAARSNGL